MRVRRKGTGRAVPGRHNPNSRWKRAQDAPAPEAGLWKAGRPPPPQGPPQELVEGGSQAVGAVTQECLQLASAPCGVPAPLLATPTPGVSLGGRPPC